MLHKNTLRISVVVCTLCMVVNGQELSQPVCRWNETAQSCQQNVTAVIDLLTRTKEAFGFMMRCEYAATQQDCDNIRNNTCVWAQNRCRVSARYLADSMQGCLDADSYNIKSYQVCKEDLEKRVSGLQWVDYDKLSYYSECYGFVSSSPTCRLIDNAHNCAYQSSTLNCVSNKQQSQGRSLSKDIQYLLDERYSSFIVEISKIESELGIKLGNLQLYDYCHVLGNSSCEALDSSVLQYTPPPPSPPSPPSTPSPPPSPPPPPPQQELETAVCEWDRRSRTCKQSPSGLVDLLASTNSTFANMMSCSFIQSVSECNNTANGACVWDKNFCHIAATYLVDALTDCLYPQSDFSDIEECKQQMKSVAQGQDWVDGSKYTSENYDDKCEDVQGFSYNQPYCKLLDAALNCDSSYSNYCSRYYSYSSTSVKYQLGYNLTSQVKYLMDRSFSSSYVLDLVYLEENLNIKNGNLQTYDYCDNRRMESECKTIASYSPSYSSSYSPRLYYSPRYYYSPSYYYSSSSRSRNDDNSSSVSGGGIFGIILGLVLGAKCCILGCICYAREQNRQNGVTQTGTGGGVQAQVQLAQAAQNAPMDGAQTTDILANLPTLEYMGQRDGESGVTCAICMEDLQQGDQSTVLPCAHWYHKNCIEQWTQTRGRNVACPICNQRVQDSTVVNAAAS